jgi:hypothetical protein
MKRVFFLLNAAFAMAILDIISHVPETETNARSFLWRQNNPKVKYSTIRISVGGVGGVFLGETPRGGKFLILNKNDKCKCKVLPTTDHEGPEGEYRYISTLSLPRR